MQRNRKMTLNEEFALMRKMFHSMGITEVLKENKIRLNESLGGPIGPSVLDGLTPGSSVAIIGKTVLPEIETAILMSAKNSDLIMTQLGKKVGDNLTFDDIINSGLMGATKREVAQSIVQELGEGGVTLMKNLGDIMGGANSSSLKNQIAELSTEPQRKVQSKLQQIQKQIDVPDEVQKKANLETISDLLPGLRKVVDDEISLTAPQKKAINELFDSLEAQANAYKSKINDLIKFDEATQRVVNNTLSEIENGNFSPIRNVIDADPNIPYKVTDGEMTIIKNAIDQFSDGQVDAVLKEIGEPALKGNNPGSRGSGYLTSGGMDPEKLERTMKGIQIIVGGIFKLPAVIIENILPNLSKGQKRTLLALIWIGLLAWGVYALYQWLESGKAKEAAEDLITPDSKDEDCVENLPGYNGLDSEKKKFVISHYGCAETKNNTTNPVKSFGVDENTECLVAVRQDGTSEKWKVTAGGAGEPCGGNNVIPPPNNSCTCTQDDLEKAVQATGAEYEDASFNSTTCTLTYTITKLNNKEVPNPEPTSISCSDIGK